MSIGRGLIVATLALALAGCGDATRTDGSQALPTASVEARTAAPPGATVTGSPEISPIPVGLLLPTELGGVELHTFAVGQDSVARLLTELDAAPAELEIAYASEHGARFLQLYALRVRGVDGEALLNAFVAAAYDPAAGTIDRSDEEIADHSVTVINQPATAGRLGTFYAYTLGDALLVAQGFDRQTVEDGLGALP
ncbi:MAG TPA: hypothetical protein VEW45_03470 [Candidatus Dormibacteraeota bacterium]|nr:hypothetical protein [Candidatus Dormibacteraeota bacterium]